MRYFVRSSQASRNHQLPLLPPPNPPPALPPENPPPMEPPPEDLGGGGVL